MDFQSMGSEKSEITQQYAVDNNNNIERIISFCVIPGFEIDEIPACMVIFSNLFIAPGVFFFNIICFFLNCTIPYFLRTYISPRLVVLLNYFYFDAMISLFYRLNFRLKKHSILAPDLSAINPKKRVILLQSTVSEVGTLRRRFYNLTILFSSISWIVFVASFMHILTTSIYREIIIPLSLTSRSATPMNIGIGLGLAQSDRGYFYEYMTPLASPSTKHAKKSNDGPIIPLKPTEYNYSYFDDLSEMRLVVSFYSAVISHLYYKGLMSLDILDYIPLISDRFNMSVSYFQNHDNYQLEDYPPPETYKPVNASFRRLLSYVINGKKRTREETIRRNSELSNLSEFVDYLRHNGISALVISPPIMDHFNISKDSYRSFTKISDERREYDPIIGFEKKDGETNRKKQAKKSKRKKKKKKSRDKDKKKKFLNVLSTSFGAKVFYVQMTQHIFPIFSPYRNFDPELNYKFIRSFFCQPLFYFYFIILFVFSGIPYLCACYLRVFHHWFCKQLFMLNTTVLNLPPVSSSKEEEGEGNDKSAPPTEESATSSSSSSNATSSNKEKDKDLGSSFAAFALRIFLQVKERLRSDESLNPLRRTDFTELMTYLQRSSIFQVSKPYPRFQKLMHLTHESPVSFPLPNKKSRKDLGVQDEMMYLEGFLYPNTLPRRLREGLWEARNDTGTDGKRRNNPDRYHLSPEDIPSKQRRYDDISSRFSKFNSFSSSGFLRFRSHRERVVWENEFVRMYFGDHLSPSGIASIDVIEPLCLGLLGSSFFDLFFDDNRNYFIYRKVMEQEHVVAMSRGRKKYKMKSTLEVAEEERAKKLRDSLLLKNPSHDRTDATDRVRDEKKMESEEETPLSTQQLLEKFQQAKKRRIHLYSLLNIKDCEFVQKLVWCHFEIYKWVAYMRFTRLYKSDMEKRHHVRTIEELRNRGIDEDDMLQFKDGNKVSINWGREGNSIVMRTKGDDRLAEPVLIDVGQEERMKVEFFRFISDYFNVLTKVYYSEMAGQIFTAFLVFQNSEIFKNAMDSFVHLSKVLKDQIDERIKQLNDNGASNSKDNKTKPRSKLDSVIDDNIQEFTRFNEFIPRLENFLSVEMRQSVESAFNYLKHREYENAEKYFMHNEYHYYQPFDFLIAHFDGLTAPPYVNDMGKKGKKQRVFQDLMKQQVIKEFLARVSAAAKRIHVYTESLDLEKEFPQFFVQKKKNLVAKNRIPENRMGDIPLQGNIVREATEKHERMMMMIERKKMEQKEEEIEGEEEEEEDKGDMNMLVEVNKQEEEEIDGEEEKKELDVDELEEVKLSYEEGVKRMAWHLDEMEKEKRILDKKRNKVRRRLVNYKKGIYNMSV